MTRTKYDEIKAFLKAEALKPESRTKMPSIQQLMKRFSASQSPVSRAVHDLERENILYCRRGVGIVSRYGAMPYTIKSTSDIASTGVVAVLMTDYFASSLWQMTHTLGIYAQQQGYTAQNYPIHRGDDRVALLREIAQQENLLGVVVISTADRLEEAFLDFAGQLSVPVVLLDSYFSYETYPDNVSLLRPDALANGKMCAEYLHQQGHQRIAVVRAISDGTIPQLMIAGSQEAAKEHDFAVQVFSGAIQSWESTRDAARKITLTHLDEIITEGISALMVLDSSGALAINRVLWERGIKVPESLSLLAHGDDLRLEDSTPGLTTTRTDFTRMSCDALDIVFGKLPYQAERLYPAELIERESVAVPATSASVFRQSDS